MTVDALERHAERGAQRGPSAVWAAATAVPAVDHRTPGPERQRVLVWAAVVILAALGLVVLRGVEVGRPPVPDEAAVAAEGATSTGDDGLPAPLLIGGMELATVQVPFDPDACCPDDLLDRAKAVVVDSGDIAEFSAGDPSTGRTQIFATDRDLTAGPILGVEHLPGGGFRPWGANLNGVTLDELTAGMERVGDDWRPGQGSGLVEVADVAEESPFHLVRFGWQFDFEDGDRLAILQSESGERASVGLWLARLVGGGGSASASAAFTVEPAVIGSGPDAVDGLVLIQPPRMADDPPDAQVIWEADGWVHRLTIARVADNTAYPEDARAMLGDVHPVDRAEWVAAVNEAGRWSPSWSSAAGLVGFALGAAWVVAVARIVRRRWAMPVALLVGFVAVLLLGRTEAALTILAGLVVGALLVDLWPRLEPLVPRRIRDLRAWADR